MLRKRIFPLTFLIFFLSAGQAVYGQNILTYKTYDSKTDRIINKFFVKVSALEKGVRTISWELIEDGKSSNETYVLDENYATQNWKVTDKNKGMDYSGKREGNSIIIEGDFNGERIDKRLAIDGAPFYFNPKFGLMGFVLSKAKRIEFWGVRQDTLAHYKMKAKKVGKDLVMINGEPVEALEVHWTVAGPGSMFFKRIYWFRASDGLYIRQRVSGIGYRELVNEGGGK